MGSGQNTQCPVRFIAIVQVDTNREDSLQDCRWWLDMTNAGFRRPRSVTWEVDSSGNTNRQILVPRNQPVCSGSLVKERASNWKADQPQVVSNDPAHFRRMSQAPCDRRQMQKIAHRVNAAPRANSIFLVNARNGFNQGP